VAAYYVVLFGATAYATQHPLIRRRIAAQLRLQVSAPALMLGTAAIAALVWTAALARPDGLLHVWFLAVGEGSAVLVQTPGGAHVLIDTGENPTRLLTALGDRLPFRKQRLDVLLITNWRGRSVGALDTLLTRYAVGALLTVGPPDEAARTLRRAEVAITPVTRGWQLDFSDGAALEVVFEGAPGSEEAALVIQLRYGTARFLLMPEMSASALVDLENSLDEAVRASTLIQLPGNGAARANPPEWLARLTPQVVVIVAEAGNRSAQPDPAVLRAFESRAVPTLRTDQRGTVHARSDGRTLWLTTAR
jgi:competence protein ComEC